MGWFIGLTPATGIIDRSESKFLKDLLSKLLGEDPVFAVSNDRLLLLGGGLPDLFKAQITPGTNAGWLACGVGIRSGDGVPSLMHEKDWDALLSGAPSEEKVHALGGHFTAISWSENRIEIFCDVLELSRVYFTRIGNLHAFSSRLDWMVSLLPGCSIDPEEIASAWTLINSLSDKCFVRGLSRLGPSGHLSIINGSLNHTWHHWTPTVSPEVDVTSLLREMVALPLRDGKRLTLGLSGGIDSRTLLAILLGSPAETWQVHSIGDTNNRDISVAAMLAKEFAVKHQICYYTPNQNDSAEKVAAKLRDYSMRTEMSDSPFGYPKLDLFDDMGRRGFWMIDGAYGELLRRSYGHTLLPAVKPALRENNFLPMINRLASPRSAFFAREIRETFGHAIMAQMENAIRSMPHELEDDPENWIDLFHLRYRLKNYAGGSQGLYDSHIPNYMPFAQPSILNASFSIALQKRRNNRINRQMILEGDKRLTKIPLLSYGVVVPYWTCRNISLSRLIGKIKREFLSRNHETERSFRLNTLLLLREFILDRIHSTDVEKCELYDHVSLDTTVRKFYLEPNETDAQIIDDWLTFDFWREKPSDTLSSVHLG